MRIVQIITCLNDGGAEGILFNICKNDNKNKHIVISLMNEGKYGPLLNNLGIKVYCLNMKPNIFSIFSIFRLVKILMLLKPDIVQTWLIHGDFIGGIAARLAGIKNVIWNVRYSKLEIVKTKISSILLIKLLSKLSFLIPKLIIVVSKSAKKNCENLSYSKKKLFLIPNGYDLSILNPSKTKRIFIRKKWKIKKQIPVIGNVARYDPKKDHMNLLNALSLIRLRNIDFFCILAGSNIDKKNKILVSEIKRLNLGKYVKLLGQKKDISQVMNGLDIYVQSSSNGEGFPNVVAEAMACGTPCVVTDVGDAAFIVGNTGLVVSPKNPIKLAKAIEFTLNELSSKNWINKSNHARLRIKDNFDITKMLKSYNKVWVKTLGVN